MNGYCAYCGKQLTTGDFNGICQECRQRGHSELIDLQPLTVKTSNDTKLGYIEETSSIKLGDTYNCDGYIWTVTRIDEEGVYIEMTHKDGTNFMLNVCTLDGQIWAYRKLKKGNWRGVNFTFTLDEIEMVHDIITKLKGE